MRSLAAVAFLVGAFTMAGATVSRAQHRGGAGASTSSTQSPAGAHASPRVPNPTHRGPVPPSTSRPQGFTSPNPVLTPFPNVATLSGPLPRTFGQRLPADGYRVRGRFDTGPAYFPGYAYGAPIQESVPSAAGVLAPPQPVATGTLRIDAAPLDAQVFIDGYYTGTIDDIGKQRGLTLPEGPHRLDLRARGYVPDTIDVVVPARDTVTYRSTLDPERPAPPAGPPTAAAATMYVVPDCYIGNVPPRTTRFGSGCDLSKVQVIPPPSASGAVDRKNGR